MNMALVPPLYLLCTTQLHWILEKLGDHSHSGPDVPQLSLKETTRASYLRINILLYDGVGGEDLGHGPSLIV